MYIVIIRSDRQDELKTMKFQAILIIIYYLQTQNCLFIQFTMEFSHPF